MKLYFLLLPILIWGFIFADCAVSADRSAGNSNKRWGVTTKDPVEDGKDEIEGGEFDLKNNHKDSLTDQKMSGGEEGPDAGGKPKEPKEKIELIKWESETQQSKCNAYLASLKETFLKARYYSIQGVPCATAENARSFMTLINLCKRDCPDKFLKRNGYTTRIIRNLSWLEKLGSERCPDMNISLPPQRNRLRIPQGRQADTDEHRLQGKKGG